MGSPWLAMGPYSGKNGAVGSRKVFRYLPDLREAT